MGRAFSHLMEWLRQRFDVTDRFGPLRMRRASQPRSAAPSAPEPSYAVWSWAPKGASPQVIAADLR